MIVGTIILSSFLFPQSIFGQIELSGKWTGKCIIENIDETSISFCDFCPREMNKESSTITFNQFEIEFKNDYFLLYVDEILKGKSKYLLDESLKTLDFTFNDENYKFKVLTVMSADQNKYILKSEEGGLILLEKE